MNPKKGTQLVYNIDTILYVYCRNKLPSLFFPSSFSHEPIIRHELRGTGTLLTHALRTAKLAFISLPRFRIRPR